MTTETVQPISDEDRAALVRNAHYIADLNAPYWGGLIDALDARLTAAEAALLDARKQMQHLADGHIAEGIRADRALAAQDVLRDALVAVATRIQNDHGVWVIRRPHADMHALMALVNAAMQATATPQTVTMEPGPDRVLTDECCNGCGAPWGTRHAEACRNVPIAKGAPCTNP